MDKKNRRIQWKIHCTSAVETIFRLLDSNEGRKSFWAESAEEAEGHIRFRFPNGQEYISRIVERIPNRKFSLIYFDSLATFLLSECENGGTDLTLIHEDVPAGEYEETYAGWVSVLLTLKAFTDFGIDLRNHDRHRTWDEGFVDN